MKKKIWMTYDLGVGGDYSGLYEWLDDHNAKECGDSNAFVEIECPNNIDSDDKLSSFIKEDLGEKVKIMPSNRIYVIWKTLDQERQGNMTGRFIYGKRKANPWEGYGTKTENVIDE